MSISVKQLKRILGSFSQAVAKDVSGINTNKQNKLIAGENIKIAEDGTISATAANANVDLSAYAKKSELPHTEDFVLAAVFNDAYNHRLVRKEDLPALDTIATKQEVEEKVNAIQVPSIEGLAKETEVETKLADYAKTSEVAATYATKEAVNAINGLDADTIATLKNLSEHSDLTTIANKVDNVYTKAETDDKLAAKADVTAIPSVEGLAKVTDVESTYAKKTELPDVSSLATKQEVTDAVAGVQVPSIEGLAKTTDVDTKLEAYAKKTELPDVTTLATKAEVAAITVPSVEGFVKGTEVDAKLVDYAKTAEVEATYAKKTELPDVSGLATKTEMTAAIAGVEVPSIEGLAKTSEVDTKLADYAKTTDVESTYAKKAEIPSVEGFAKTTEVETKLADYAKSTDIANTYATKEAVNAVAGLDAETVNSLKALAQNSDLTTVAEKVKNVYTKAETDDKLAAKADVTAIPDVSGLAVKTEVETTYAKKTELPDVSGLATKAEVATAVAGVTVPSIEGLAKTTEVEAKLADYAKKTELPSIEGLAKVTDVDTKLAAKADVSAIPDVSGLATKAEVAAVDAKFATKADTSAIPSIEGLAKTTDVEATYAKKTELPDVSGLATKAEVAGLKTELVTEETLTQNINQLSTVVDGKINEAKGELEAKVTAVDGKLAEYAKKTELPDVSGLATKAEVTTAVAGVQVPSIEGLAKTTEVEAKLADYAKTAEVETTYAKKTELPDVSGLAKTTEVVAKSVYDEKVQSLESEIIALKAKLAAVASGTTEQRPTENNVVGQQFFDTTLGVPVYWNGTEWHNPFANITTVEVENH